MVFRARETLRRDATRAVLSLCPELLIKERAAFDLGAEGRVSPNVHPGPDRLAILNLCVAGHPRVNTQLTQEAGIKNQEAGKQEALVRESRSMGDRGGRLPDS